MKILEKAEGTRAFRQKAREHASTVQATSRPSLMSAQWALNHLCQRAGRIPSLPDASIIVKQWGFLIDSKLFIGALMIYHVNPWLSLVTICFEKKKHVMMKRS
jgi:hypothetical protein